MLIDTDQLITAQFTATRPATVKFADGRKTDIAPVRYVPQLNNPVLSLDGEWRVARWPFRSETRLTRPTTSDAR